MSTTLFIFTNKIYEMHEIIGLYMRLLTNCSADKEDTRDCNKTRNKKDPFEVF